MTDVKALADGLWLVWGIRGEYSDRTEWPVAIYADEADAQEACVRLKQLSRDLYAIYRSREDEPDAAGDWSGETLLATTEEGRAFADLNGHAIAPGSYDFDEMEFTCWLVPFRAELARRQKEAPDAQ